MTLSEAITVMKIMATADNWCSTCGPSLIEQFGKAFPKFVDIADNFDIETLKKLTIKNVMKILIKIFGIQMYGS